MAGIGAYDPRRQAHVSLTYKNDQQNLSAAKSCELSQLYTTGRSTAPLSVSSGSASKGGKKGEDKPYFSRQLTEYESAVNPPYLDRNGRWDQRGLSTFVTQTQSQPVTTTGRFDGSHGPVQAPRAISAVYSYHDTSPVLTAEYARDTDRSEATWEATINKRGTNGVYTPPKPEPPSRFDTMVESTLRPSTRSRVPPGTAFGDAESRKTNIEAFWQRNGAASHLKEGDVLRIGDEIGVHAVPGTGNSRLVGGKWRYIPRPTEGVHLMTDYYGRCGSKQDDYYGRTYHYLQQ